MGIIKYSMLIFVPRIKHKVMAIGEKISYIETNGKFLIVPEKGKSILLKSRKEFDTYVTDNKCKIVK